MRKVLLLIVLTFVSVFAAVPRGNGSVSFNDYIIPILKSRPDFGRYILGTFKFYGDPMGNLMGNTFSPALSGGRIGPYDMWASWNGNTGEIPVVLVINTKINFYDKNNTKIKKGDFKKAVRFSETLDSIEVYPTEDKFLKKSIDGQIYSLELLE